MLIPNKFNGYSRDGIRRYHIGGGVGEAMLLGAAVGGGSAAITGGDPLKGALLGGLTGGAGAGISSGLSALAPEATTALTSAGGAGGAAGGAGASTLGASLTPTTSNLALGAQGANLGTATSAVLPNAATTSGLPGMLPNAASLPAGAGSVNYALGAPSFTPGAGVASNIGAGAGTSGIAALPNAASVAPTTGGTFTEGMTRFANDPMASIMRNKFTAGAAGLTGAMYGRDELEGPEEYNGPLKRFRFNPETYRSAQGYADGGITALTSGGYDRMVGEEPMYPANMASGGISNLGTYSDGGRMLKGPGDGMSDSIPGVIGGKRPARLADGEFVVPADVVSHLGNGSTDAGARQLYSMMDKVRKARTGSKKQGREINPRKYALA